VAFPGVQALEIGHCALELLLIPTVKIRAINNGKMFFTWNMVNDSSNKETKQIGTGPIFPPNRKRKSAKSVFL
jgi:hypothetical protein